MTSWQIEPQGVLAVLTSVQGESTELGTAFTGIIAAQTETNSGVGAILSSAAAAAIGLIESQQGVVVGIVSRIEACGLGAGAAATAYVAGDEEMAARTQTAAVLAAGSGDLSFFGVAH